MLLLLNQTNKHIYMYNEIYSYDFWQMFNNTKRNRKNAYKQISKGQCQKCN